MMERLSRTLKIKRVRGNAYSSERCAQAKNEKSILMLMMVTTVFFYSGQSRTDSVYVGTLESVKANVVIKGEDRDLTKAGLAKATETGMIYNSTSPHHNVLHHFTYLAAMRDCCTKTLLQMRANGEANKKFSEKLERELSKAKAELASAKFNG